ARRSRATSGATSSSTSTHWTPAAPPFARRATSTPAYLSSPSDSKEVSRDGTDPQVDLDEGGDGSAGDARRHPCGRLDPRLSEPLPKQRRRAASGRYGAGCEAAHREGHAWLGSRRERVLHDLADPREPVAQRR